MTFKPAIWRPIAFVLSIANIVGAAFAARSAEVMHTSVHVMLAVAFGLWAQRLRQGGGGNELAAGLEALEFELSNLRRELAEMQERLDFVERVLAQGSEAPRVGPQR